MYDVIIWKLLAAVSGPGKVITDPGSKPEKDGLALTFADGSRWRLMLFPEAPPRPSDPPLEAECKHCGEPVFKSGYLWIDHTGGESCEGGPHEPEACMTDEINATVAYFTDEHVEQKLRETLAKCGYQLKEDDGDEGPVVEPPADERSAHVTHVRAEEEARDVP